ncbi:MAG TPA: flavin reductase family protein [Bryobacteraceae bacterium]|nr:flavin reductase family protein [Bryobacteraceae bacterium]
MSSESTKTRAEDVSSEDFRRACGRFATGVAIASVMDEAGTAHGLTVSSFTSVSLNPPLLLICLGQEVTMIEAFRRAPYFGINILREQDRELSQRFATKGLDRFNGIGWRPGRTGVPLIDSALATIECETYQRFGSGDHDILVGRVVGTRVEEGTPLLYYASRYRKLALD